jgi:predicted negative regulator of RcsB-dependent stress response
VRYHRRAVELLGDLGDQHNQAGTLHHLGDALYAAGDHLAAAAAYEQAMDIFTEQGHPNADEVGRKLDALAFDSEERTTV